MQHAHTHTHTHTHTHIHTQSPKNISKSLNSFLFTKNTGYCFCTQSSFPWFYAWDLGIRVWMQLFQLSSTPLTFQISFLAFIFLFTRIICFITFFDMFLALSCFNNVFSLNPYSFMLVHMFICLDLHAQGFMPRFMLKSTSIHAYMFRSKCLGFYAMFRLFCSSLCFALMLGLCAHMLDIMSTIMLCSNLCVCMIFAMFYAQIYICTCLQAWIHVLPCIYASFHMPTHVLPCLCLDLCLCAQIYVFTCLSTRIYTLLALCHLPCTCALHAMIVCLDLGYVCLAMCYCSPFVALPFFLAFWPIGSNPIQTLWSLSQSIHLGP